MQKTQRPDGAVVGSSKRLASRFYRLKMGHARIGQYLHWAGVRSTAQCWWCQYPTQTREHLLKVCSKWKEPRHRGMRVVPLQDADAGTLVQEPSALEETTNKRFCGRRCGGIWEEGRTVSRSETCSRMNGAPVRFWTSCVPQRWGAGSHAINESSSPSSSTPRLGITNKPTSGPSWPLTRATPTEWNSPGVRYRVRYGRNPLPSDLSSTWSARSPRPSGRRRRRGWV